MLGCLAKALAILSTYTQKDSNLAVLFQMNALCIQLVEGCLINQRCGSEFHNISLHCSSTKKREKFQTAFYSSGICWLNYTATHCDVMAHCVICNEPLFSGMTQNKWMHMDLSIWSSLRNAVTDQHLWCLRCMKPSQLRWGARSRKASQLKQFFL